MEFLVIVLDALKHLYAFFDRRLSHGNRLETALKRGILLDILAILVKSGSTYNPYLSARERGFEDICGVYASLGVTDADDIMHLVDNENNVPCLLDLVYKTYHSGFKLSSELSARNECRHIYEIYLLSAKLEGYASVCYSLRESLCDGSFTYARLTYKARIVLLTAAEYLYNSLKLAVSANDPVKLSVSRSSCKIAAVGVEEFIFLRLFLALILCFFLAFSAAGMLSRNPCVIKELRHIYSGCAALLKIVVVRGDRALLYHSAKLVLHSLHLLGRKTELAHYVAKHIIYRNTEILCTFHAESLVDLISVF